MVGVTKRIRKVFAPTWQFKRLTIPKHVGGMKKSAAKRRGKRIDREMDAITKDTPIKRTCRETKALLKFFESRNVTLCHSQYKVSLKLLSTFLDLVVIDPDGKLYVVEIKRGCHYRHIDNGHLNHHTNVTNCLLHQHQLQAMIGRWLYETQEQVKNVGCILIYVENDDIEVYDEDQFVVELNESAKLAVLDIRKKQCPKTKPGLKSCRKKKSCTPYGSCSTNPPN